MAGYSDREGNYHDTYEQALSKDQQNQASGHWAYKGQSSSEKAMGDMGAKALAGGAGIGVILMLVVPLILVVIIEELFGFLFNAKTIGKVFQSVLMGLLSCVIITIAFIAVAVNLNIDSKNIVYIVGFAGYAAGAIWYYFSHYYSVKAALDDERFAINSTFKAGLFVDSFGIMFYGYIVAFIASAFVKVVPIVIVLFIAPLIAGIILYIKRILSVRYGASVIKGEERSQPIGALAALAVVPLFLLISKIISVVAAFVIIIGVPTVYGIVVFIRNKIEKKRLQKIELAERERLQKIKSEERKARKAQERELEAASPSEPKKNYLEYTGDVVWVKNLVDGCFYPAKAKKIISDDIVEVTYLNDEKEERNKNDVLSFSEAIKRKPYTPHSFSEEEGKEIWYLCQICKVIDDQTISIRYEDGTKVNIPPQDLAFIKR